MSDWMAAVLVAVCVIVLVKIASGIARVKRAARQAAAQPRPPLELVLRVNGPFSPALATAMQVLVGVLQAELRPKAPATEAPARTDAAATDPSTHTEPRPFGPLRSASLN